jgi:hypothetical protein
MPPNVLEEDFDAIRKLQHQNGSISITLPKQQIYDKLGIKIDDLDRRHIPIEIEEETNSLNIQLPTPE